MVGLPEFCNGTFPKLIELDFLREDIERDIDRPAEPPAALVVVDDSLEAVSVPVEEILIVLRVVVADPAAGVAQQGVGELDTVQ